MEPLVQASLVVRRTSRRAHGLVLACGLAAYVISGGAVATFGPALGAAIAAWLYLVASRLRAKLGERGDGRRLFDMGPALLLGVGVPGPPPGGAGGLGGRS